MADQSFDIVIVGGGTKALYTAMYLTKFGGLSVGIFEEKLELGGGLCSFEATGGFVDNPCSYIMWDWYFDMFLEDVPEFQEGFEWMNMKCSYTTIFLKEQSCLTYYMEMNDPTQELTAREIARFSKKDAETWLWMWEKYKKVWFPYIHEWMWTPAQPIGTPDGLEKLIYDPNSEIDPYWMHMSPIEMYREIFESPEVIESLAKASMGWGWELTQRGMGFGALIFVPMTLCTNLRSVKGGSHQLAHAAQKVILQNGGKAFTQRAVKKIIIENGRATGVQLADGTQVEAKKAVLANIEPRQLCFDLIGEEYFSPKILKRIKNTENTAIVDLSVDWYFKDRPRYIAEKFNPDVWNSGVTDLVLGGGDGGEALVRDCYERRLRQIPSKMWLYTGGYGAPDGLVAPKGIDYIWKTEQLIIPATQWTEKQWKEFEKRIAGDILEVWQQYAPNLTWDNVIGYSPQTPWTVARTSRNFGPHGNWGVLDHTNKQFGRNRPIPELADHRMPIKNLYATSSAWHPFGGVMGAQGYNAYKAMAEDLGLRKPWEEKGRPY